VREYGSVHMGTWWYVSMCLYFINYVIPSVLYGELGWIGLGSMVVCTWVCDGFYAPD